MGCMQAKPTLTSPDRNGVERLKAEHGYVGGSQGMQAVGPKEEAKEECGCGGGGAARRGPPPLIERKMEDDLVDGWPRWLVSNVPKGVLDGLVPKSADNYVMIGKVGQGTYSNVYKARDKDTGKLVALKKVRFDTSESESVRFMAREIMILQKLDHPNVLKLEGLATSRMQYSLYLVFEFMQTDLARIISCPDGRLTEPQVKCYMHQLLSGLQHCHERGILHRDIKGSNLLIDKHGMLKIGDFGLANYFNPDKKQALTSRVVTLWYRAPELLLGATDYGVGIDLWSVGCLLAEMFAGRPIMPGRTEVEQLHRIFKLCGSPTEDYWRKLKLSTNFRSPTLYQPSILETFRDLPASSLGLLTTLLALDPAYRGTAASALQNEFFSTSPLACDLSGLPVIYQEEDDDSIQPRERRKRKSKMKQKALSHIEYMTKFKQDVQIPKADYYSSKEDVKAGELATQSQEPESSAASTSSSVKADTHTTISPQSLSPVASTLSKQSPASITEYHPSAAKNIMNPTSWLPKQSPGTEYHPASAKNIMNLLPPRPAYKFLIADRDLEGLDFMQHRFGLERRSVSMADVGRVVREQLSKHYALDG